MLSLPVRLSKAPPSREVDSDETCAVSSFSDEQTSTRCGMEEDMPEQMEACDTDEGSATRGKERLGQLKSDQLFSQPPAGAESLSSRRAGESSFTAYRGSVASPDSSVDGSLTGAVQHPAGDLSRGKSAGYHKEGTGVILPSQVTASLTPREPGTPVSATSAAHSQSSRMTSEFRSGLREKVAVGSETSLRSAESGIPEALRLRSQEASPMHSMQKEVYEADLLLVPDDDQEWMRPRRPPPADSAGPSSQLNGPLLPESERINNLQVANEEEEWLERKRVTGVIGRMVQYQHGEIPAKDVIGLHRTSQNRLMVTAVRADGPASRAGVVAGDQLISIDGEKIWEYYPAKAVLTGVKGPVTLIFLGFSGKLQAEVRVKQPDEPRLGLPPQISVPGKVMAKSKREDGKRRWLEAQPSEIPSLHLKDTVVFEQKVTSSLLIATEEAEDAQTQHSSNSSNDARPKSPQPEASAATSSSSAGVYELLQQDAREILFRALKGDFV
eukprot:gb/GFBE01074728.1/.p1 GENE.gb/GFBE01074728.1/~~gb/GFBE01074728.1/.p1  ORF type:complete len:498 (+),score=87.12 gb/GFBE01074728.1/:1-1494(+)